MQENVFERVYMCGGKGAQNHGTQCAQKNIKFAKAKSTLIVSCLAS